MSLLNVEHLSVQFHGAPTPTVHDLSFSLAEGKALAIVGESGSGKSITALSLLRINPATYCPTGTIQFDGANMLDATDSELEQVRGNQVGMVFQEPMTALNPLHTLYKQLNEILSLHGFKGDKKARKERIWTLLQEVELDHLRDRLHHYPHQLSGGERQRMMIAMAIANRPKLLIADEPTTALDISTQTEIMKLLQRLKTEHHMALLFITHDLHLVRNFADHVIVMRQGEAVEQGTTEALFTHPKHEYSQKLMNAIHQPEPIATSDTKQPIITTDGLNVSYTQSVGFSLRRAKRHIALEPANITLHQGETLGIVGESGSGKTTLGLAIAQLITSEGRVEYKGKQLDTLDNKSLRAIRKEIQFVFQDPFSSLNPRMNIAQIIGEGLALHYPEYGEATQFHHIRTIMTEVGLEPDMMDRYPHEFSGGQRQRINIARAMILKPQCVIFDEPTSALDITLQTQITTLLKQFQEKQKIAYLFISHDMHVIKSMSHHIMVLQRGAIIEQNDAKAIFTSPQHSYTKSLITMAGL